MTGTAKAGVDGEPTAFALSPEKITYTEEDVVDSKPTTYSYTITETLGSENGVTYDTTSYSVDVTVALKTDENGTYSDELDISYEMPEGGFTFTNPYSPTPATATPHAKKSMSGDPIPNDLTFDFKFTLTAKEVVESGCALVKDPDTAIAVGDSWTKTVTVDKDNTAPSIDFNEIQYTKAGTYVYTIVENQFESDLVTCDTTEWTYTVKVVDDFHGTLSATETYTAGKATGESATFVNDYSDGLIDINGTKTWNDNNNANKLRPTSITIRLYADGTEVQKTTVTQKDDWKFSFKDLPKYKDGKEIVYTISEDAVQGYTTSIKGYDVTNTPSRFPKTGDSTDYRFWLIALIASAMVLCASAYGIKRRRQDS